MPSCCIFVSARASSSFVRSVLFVPNGVYMCMCATSVVCLVLRVRCSCVRETYRAAAILTNVASRSQFSSHRRAILRAPVRRLLGARRRRGPRGVCAGAQRPPIDGASARLRRGFRGVRVGFNLLAFLPYSQHSATVSSEQTHTHTHSLAQCIHTHTRIHAYAQARHVARIASSLARSHM